MSIFDSLHLNKLLLCFDLPSLSIVVLFSKLVGYLEAKEKQIFPVYITEGLKIQFLALSSVR
jgi:hypothetical protein